MSQLSLFVRREWFHCNITVLATVWHTVSVVLLPMYMERKIAAILLNVEVLEVASSAACVVSVRVL